MFSASRKPFVRNPLEARRSLSKVFSCRRRGCKARALSSLHSLLVRAVLATARVDP